MQIPLHGAIIDDDYAGPKLLHKALVAIRFSPVMIISQDANKAALFQEEIRATYPLMSRDQELSIQFIVTGEGAPQLSQTPETVWRYSDLGKNWRVSLTNESLALETDGDSFSSWADFSARVKILVMAIDKIYRPAVIQRLGVRYGNIAPIGAGPEEFPRVCRDCLSSVTGLEDLVSADLVWNFAVDEGRMILRSGVMPAGTSYDPPFLQAKPHQSWYLDIDVINEEAKDFDANGICAALDRQVRRTHQIYKWAVPETAREGDK